MTGLPLPALDGRTPLGFLAALGVLRLVTDHTGRPARLAWSPHEATAVLHDAQPDIDTLVADLTNIISRGRDRPHGRPPARIPACGTTAPGSCLRFWRRSARQDRGVSRGLEGAIF